MIIDGISAAVRRQRGEAQAAETFQKLSADGYRTLGVAVRTVEKQDAYTLTAEQRHDAGRVRGFPRSAEGGDSRASSRH